MSEPTKLPPEQLTCRCDDSDIRAVPDGAPPPLLPGQNRAMDALEFGLSLKKPYFNLTVAGPSRSGKTTMVEQLARKRAEREPPGRDICFAPNFLEPNRPKVLYLAPGSGAHLNRLIEELLQTLDEQIPKLVEQPTVKAHLHELNESFNGQAQELTATVEQFGAEQGIFIQTSPQGVALIPLKDGKPMRDEEFIALPQEERERINEVRRQVLARMAEINPRVMELEKQRRDAVEDFLESSVRQLLHGYMAGVRQRVEPHAQLQQFLQELEEELVRKRFLFLADGTSQPFGGAQVQALREQFARNCKVNVLVNRTGAEGAPVLVETNPTFSNLIGGVDFVEERGVLKTDYNQIRAGSLIQATGGYLVVQAHDLLQYPLAYSALKRALRTGSVTLRDQFAEWGLRSGSHLEPDAVQVNTKVVVVGDEYLIQMMHTYDDEFAGLFKVHADFSQTLVRTPEVMDQLVGYLAYHARREDLLPLTEGALARVVEEASRRVAHQNRFTAQVNELLDVLIEADVLARGQGETQLSRDLVQAALEQRQQRHSKIEEIVKREISEGSILLDFDGAKVGQVNGLAVYQVGRVAFGIPTRITAQAYAGRHGLINIEREADLSGRIHTKGVLILNGYLGKLFARQHPLALSLSITFEQSYGGIEGDSATCAEFFAALSAIAQVPLRQSIAVTGSMNQHGDVQPIGGVNEKVAGFFQFVKEHGFPEGSGVIIPAVNQVNLLLSEEIIAAVREGKFAIYPVRRIEEGLEIMTGRQAGTAGEDGTFPPESVYGLAARKLADFMPKRDRDRDNAEDNGRARREGATDPASPPGPGPGPGPEPGPR